MKICFILLLLVLECSITSFGYKNNLINESTATEYPLEYLDGQSQSSLGSSSSVNGISKSSNLTENKSKHSAAKKAIKNLVETQQKFIKKVRTRIRKVYSKIKMEAQMYDHMFNLFENSPGEQMQILSHLEDIIHQYDVGRDFAKRGGLKVLLSAFNSSDENIVAGSLLVMGSAMQGNPDVQDIAYDLHLDEALKIFFNCNSTVILSRSLYALSSYLRQRPAAQERFIKAGGLHSLLNTLNCSKISLKLKVKVVNIINDLIVEQQEILQNSFKLEEPDEFNLLQNLLIQEEIRKCNFCSILPQLLYDEEFDIQQKIIVAMNTLFPICGEKYTKVSVYLRLKELLSQYQPIENGKKNHVNDHIDTNYDSDLELSLYGDLSELMKKITKQETTKLNYNKDEL